MMEDETKPQDIELPKATPPVDTTPLADDAPDNDAPLPLKGLPPESTPPELSALPSTEPECSADGCCGYKRVFCAEFWRGLLLPWNQGDDEVKLSDVPGYLKTLCALALLMMFNQIRLPILGGRLALGDIGFLISFIPVFLYNLRHRRVFFLPLLSILVVFATIFVNFFSCPGLAGVTECLQLLEQLVCGVALMSFFLEVSPWLAVGMLVISWLGNLGVAAYQALHLGFDSVLAPADVLKQAWGFGGAYSGLFRSRMALSFFLGTCLAFLLPLVHGRKCCICRTIALLVIGCFGLTGIIHGQIFLLTSLILVSGLFLMSRKGGVLAALAVAGALCVANFCHPAAHRQTLMNTLNPLKTTQHAGEMKTNHLDFAAAIKMAKQKPWTGIGSGRYQDCIGQCYGELPNPIKNDIECDTQSGWGILLGTTGLIPTALLFILLAGCAAGGIRRYFLSGNANTLALGGSLLLLLFIGGMAVSDGMTRGLGWMLALGLAATQVPNPKEPFPSGTRITSGMLFIVCLIVAILLGCIAAKGKSSAPLPVEQCTTCSTIKPALAFSKVINASDVVKLTYPFERGKDTANGAREILQVLDGKGVPPAGEAPAMKHGGAVFTVDVPENVTCRIWLRVWWDGSCGNTVNLQIDDEPTSATIGYDGTYRRWHWLPSSRTYQLTAGLHTIILLNREDGIKFSQMLITNDNEYIPQDIEE